MAVGTPTSSCWAESSQQELFQLIKQRSPYCCCAAAEGLPAALLTGTMKPLTTPHLVLKGMLRTRGSARLTSGESPWQMGRALTPDAWRNTRSAAWRWLFQAVKVSVISFSRAACRHGRESQATTCKTGSCRKAKKWGHGLRQQSCRGARLPPSSTAFGEKILGARKSADMPGSSTGGGQRAPTSLYLLMREPADLANLPVASWADCLPPALALQQDT